MLQISKNVEPVSIRMSEVISALSYALDLVEGQSAGHAARSCMLGMRLAQQINLSTEESSALYYALLLKDLGCSSNASKMCYLFGSDDRAAKHDFKTVDWTRKSEQVKYIARNVSSEGSIIQKVASFARVAKGGTRVARELVSMRCNRGANIARQLGLPELCAEAIQALDEHFDGGGFPEALAGEEIPLLARIMGLAQTAEVFWKKQGGAACFTMVSDRAGTWFDPHLAEAFAALKGDEQLWREMAAADSASAVEAFEPMEMVMLADDGALDRIAEGFGQVIDAKSPWTFCHSAGVAEVSVGIGNVLGLSSDRVCNLRRAALLHDIGKLGISNLILDKPGKLDADELAQMRKHPAYTEQILQRVGAFADLAPMAASHHERLDGRGYHRGVAAGLLGVESRILAVADMYEALAARRPYRQDLSKEEVMTILAKQEGTGICPIVFEALKSFLAASHFTPIQLAA